MPASNNAALRQTIATLLSQEAATEDGALALPAAAGRVYGRLALRLVPLIGDGGVAALIARSLHLAQREFPCLAELRPSEFREGFAQLGPCLARQEPQVATEAAAAVLATFTELLEALVGERLTGRLLDGAWSDSFSDRTRR